MTRGVHRSLSCLLVRSFQRSRIEGPALQRIIQSQRLLDQRQSLGATSLPSQAQAQIRSRIRQTMIGRGRIEPERLNRFAPLTLRTR
jgi:hypothetical protein